MKISNQYLIISKSFIKIQGHLQGTYPLKIFTTFSILVVHIDDGTLKMYIYALSRFGSSKKYTFMKIHISTFITHPNKFKI